MEFADACLHAKENPGKSAKDNHGNFIISIRDPKNPGAMKQFAVRDPEKEAELRIENASEEISGADRGIRRGLLRGSNRKLVGDVENELLNNKLMPAMAYLSLAQNAGSDINKKREFLYRARKSLGHFKLRINAAEEESITEESTERKKE